jgi:hypothetical protein
MPDPKRLPRLARVFARQLLVAEHSHFDLDVDPVGIGEGGPIKLITSAPSIPE